MTQLLLFPSASLFEPPVFEAIREALNLGPEVELNGSVRFSALTRSEMDWFALFESLTALADPVANLPPDAWFGLGGNPGFQRGRLPQNPLSEIVTYFASQVESTPKNVALVCAAAKLLKHRSSPSKRGRNILSLRQADWPGLYRELNAVFQTPDIELNSDQWERLWFEKNGTATINQAIADGDVLRMVEKCCDVIS